MEKMMFTNASTQAVFEERNFEDFNKLMFETGLKKQQVGAKEANDKIREVFHEILGTTESSNKKEIRKAIRRHKVDIFEVTEELVPSLLRTGWQENPFFNEYVEYRNAEDGDMNEFYVEDDVILTVSELSGGHHDIIRQKLGEGSTYAVKTSWYGVKIYAEFEKFMAGRVDWAKFVQKIYEALDNKVNSMVYEALIGAPAKVMPTGRFNKAAAVSSASTQAAKDTIKETIVQLVDDLQAVTGDEVCLVGTKVALAKLDGLGAAEWISENMKEERHTTGRIGLWEGIRKVEIPQGFKAGSTKFDEADRLAANTKILVLPSEKFIKMYDEGEGQVKEVTDGNTNMDQTVEYEYQQKMGVAAIINKKFGEITLS